MLKALELDYQGKKKNEQDRRRPFQTVLLWGLLGMRGFTAGGGERERSFLTPHIETE